MCFSRGANVLHPSLLKLIGILRALMELMSGPEYFIVVERLIVVIIVSIRVIWI